MSKPLKEVSLPLPPPIDTQALNQQEKNLNEFGKRVSIVILLLLINTLAVCSTLYSVSLESNQPRVALLLCCVGVSAVATDLITLGFVVHRLATTQN